MSLVCLPPIVNSIESAAGVRIKSLMPARMNQIAVSTLRTDDIGLFVKCVVEVEPVKNKIVDLLSCAGIGSGSCPAGHLESAALWQELADNHVMCRVNWSTEY